MFEQFNFHQTQLEYIKGAEEVIPTYRPFGKTPVQVGTMITNCAPVRDAYLEKLNGLNSARGEAQVAVEALSWKLSQVPQEPQVGSWLSALSVSALIWPLLREQVQPL